MSKRIGISLSLCKTRLTCRPLSLKKTLSLKKQGSLRELKTIETNIDKTMPSVASSRAAKKQHIIEKLKNVV